MAFADICEHFHLAQAVTVMVLMPKSVLLNSNILVSDHMRAMSVETGFAQEITHYLL